MLNRWTILSVLIILLCGVYLFHALVPLSHPPSGKGTCYALEGFQLRNTFAVYINHQGVPNGINWDLDVNAALSDFNSQTHFKLYTITTQQVFAQVTISFGQVGSSSELGVTYLTWDQSTGTENSATITLDQTKPWSDNPGYLVVEYNVEHVLLHEIGHVTGLNHVDQNCDDVMTPVTYNGPTRTSLGGGDIAGIRAIYGA